MEQSRQLVIVITRGSDSEVSSVALVIALGGITAGLKVSLFLTSAGVDLVRRGGVPLTQVRPLEPLAAMIADFQARGGHIMACPPCVQSRGYQQADFIEGVEIVGASKMHAAILAGAATLTF